MIMCADSTALRTHLDQPGPELDAHLDDCRRCSGLIRSVAEDAGFTRRSLELLEPPAHPDPDIETALQEALERSDSGPREGTSAGNRRRRAVGSRVALAAAAAAVCLVVAATPVGREAAAAALDAFMSERLQVVTIDGESLGTVLEAHDERALQALGDLDTGDLAEPVDVDGVAAAERVAGLSAPNVPDAPERIVALAPGTARLTLASRPGNGVPPTLDGAVLVVEMPGAIAAIYSTHEGGRPLLIGRSGQLVVRAEGAPLEAIRSFLLERDAIPGDLRAQLLAIGDWRSTIPVPIPVDGPGWKEHDLDGRPAIAFGDDSGIGALVLRQDPDGVTVVVGSVGVDEAVALASKA